MLSVDIMSALKLIYQYSHLVLRRTPLSESDSEDSLETRLAPVNVSKHGAPLRDLDKTI